MNGRNVERHEKPSLSGVLHEIKGKQHEMKPADPLTFSPLQMSAPGRGAQSISWEDILQKLVEHMTT